MCYVTFVPVDADSDRNLSDQSRKNLAAALLFCLAKSEMIETDRNGYSKYKRIEML